YVRFLRNGKRNSRRKQTGRSTYLARFAWLCVIKGVLLANVLILTLFTLDDIERGWQYGLQGGAKEWMPRYNQIGFFAVFALGALAAAI
ncbi:hypothetical protein AB9E07_35360, partial [Rhizobium leguminosarum]